jgi:multidrug efflux system membrane fusion protein
LLGKGLANSADLAAAKSDLASAEASYTDTSIQLAATRVRAPFAGLLNDRFVEIGDLVHDGTELFHLLDLNPYLVVAHLAEQQAKSVQVGQTANATLINGQSVSGTLRYLSVLADPNTRTFAAELAIPNPERAAVPVGSTAKLRIPQGNSDLYHLSPSLLVIDLEGQLGVKAVNERDEVIFVPVSLYESDASGLWVKGLVPGTRLITRGAGFVAEGERVKPLVSADNGGR